MAREHLTVARPWVAVLACAVGLGVHGAGLDAAAENWFEIKSPHFTVWTDANDGNTRTLVWQLEQVRSALTAFWPWAKVDLPKPLLVFAARDETSIRAIAPEFWERKGSVHPASVWVSGADRHYMVIRADVRGDDQLTVNPFTSTYFSYVHLILQSSFDRNLPLWFSRGLAGVLSNTIVRDTFLLLGPPIPWHLESLRDKSRLPLKTLVTVTRTSPEYTQGTRLDRFDAQSWALVHFLMFGEQGAHRARINAFADLLRAGKDADSAFAEAIGRPEDFETPFTNYIARNVFSYQKRAADAEIVRARFAAQPIPPAAAAAGRAVFHVAMRRPVEAKALVTEARSANPNDPDAFVAEAIQFDQAGNRDEARAAFGKAADLGTTNAYAHYRAAVLHWPRPDEAALQLMEKRLARAVDLNSAFADAYASLAEVRAMLKQPRAVVIPLITRAVTLEPSEASHRFTAARILVDFDDFDTARKAAQAGLALADTDADRQEGQNLLGVIQREQDIATRRAANPPTPSVPPPASPGAQAPAATPPSPTPAPTDRSPSALASRCQAGDAGACGDVLPAARSACTAGQRQACLLVALMQARGTGLPKDETRAFATMDQLCTGGLMEACAQLAALVASHPDTPDLPRARQLLTKSCTGGYQPACDLLKALPK